MLNLFNRKFKLILAFIFLAELFSLFAYLLPDFQQAAFFIIVLITLILSLIKLEYGVWILLAELFIGSKGYLFYFESGGVVISIRIALWLIVMAVWLGKFLASWIKNKRCHELEPGKKNIYFYYFFILFLFIAWGLANGFLNHNGFNNIFFDFNGWLYFALIFPLYGILKNKKNIYDLAQVFLAATAWLSLKTFFLLFVFSHNCIGMISELYRWVRETGVGEITQMQGGFYRIFFQSHIFILIGFFIFLLFFSDKLFKNKKLFTFNFSLLTLSLAVILISFSRSFWVGLAAGLLFYYLVILIFYKGKTVLKMSAILLVSLILAVGSIVAIVKFPYPRPLGGFDTASLISERISKTDEAAISSRWQLLPPLGAAIRKTPILGQGFGATVTYKSKDPRVLELNPSGEYTTYAFEWGWLDIWLKLGLFGLLTYLVLFGKIIYDGLQTKNDLIYGLVAGLIIIVIVSIFSPYTNHPLGIGYLLIASIIINKTKTGLGLA